MEKLNGLRPDVFICNIQARSQGVWGCDTPPQICQEVYFTNLKMGKKLDFCRRVGGGGEVQKVYFLCPKGPLFWGGGVPYHPKLILATGQVTSLLNLYNIDLIFKKKRNVLVFYTIETLISG